MADDASRSGSVDCAEATVLLAADGSRPLTVAESVALHEHADSCSECRARLARQQPKKPLRAIVFLPEDAFDDRDLRVLPQVDPRLFLADRELARGGMGRVIRARDRRLGRDVAIKEVIAPSMRARFEREASITAKLQHPAIVPIYEAGTWPDGSPFYAMRLVSGRTLAHAIADTTTLEQRVALLPHVLAITDALAYAHSRRVVHRDLKPGNVLVGEFGETVVIDWGIAKELDRDVDLVAPAAHPSQLTMVGSVMGTPGFMSPEQARGDDIDERTDVFALGAILYNLLAGSGPYADTARTPADLIAQTADRAPTPLAALAPRAPRDLVAIAERAMARDRDARYRTAKDMADELHRFAAGQLLRSRAYSARELIARWVKRHRAAVAVAAVALVVVAIGAVASVREIVRRRDDALHALALGRLEQGRRLLVDGDPAQATPYLAAAVAALPGDAVARRLATLALRDVERRVATFRGGAAAFSPDGRTLAIGRHDGSIELVDAATGRALRELPAAGGPISRVAFGASAIVTASPAGAHARDLAGGPAMPLAGDPVSDVALLGDRVVLADASGVRIVRVADGVVVASAELAGAGDLDVSPDSTLLLALGKERTLVWSLPQLAPVAVLPAMWYGRLAGDGYVVLGSQQLLERVALASPDAPLVIRNGEAQPLARAAGGIASGNELVDVAAGTSRAFAPDIAISTVAALDARHLVTSGFDGIVRVWDLDRATHPFIIVAAAESTASVIVGAGGARAASIGRRGTVELWDVSSIGAPVVHARLGAEVSRVAERGGAIAAWLHDARSERAAILDARGDRGGEVRGWLVGFAGDDVLVNDEGRLYFYTRDGTRRLSIADDAGAIEAAGVAADGGVLATSARGHVKLRDARTAVTINGFDTGTRDVTAIAIAGDHIVTGHDDGTLRIWDARTGAAIATLRGHAAHVEDVAIRGDRLFSASWDRTMRAWAFPSGESRGVVLSNTHGAAAISPSGRWLATADRSKYVAVWDAGEGRLLERIPTVDAATSVAFADDDHVIAGGATGAIELVDLRERERDDADIARLAAAQRSQLLPW